MSDERAEYLAKLVKASGQVSKAELPAPAKADLKKKVDAAVAEARRLVKVRNDMQATLEKLIDEVKTVGRRIDTQAFKSKLWVYAEADTALTAIIAAQRDPKAKGKDPVLQELYQAIQDMRMGLIDLSIFNRLLNDLRYR